MLGHDGPGMMTKGMRMLRGERGGENTGKMDANVEG
jgi:hypothetical protein